ncbi:MAG: peptidoglycan DD-metalloendopeptidase family protein [Actinomycetota bacterium]|nr:peptidoglycan DD-metalloendopeptidase family protein [Actinomycetota bacterium]
MSTALAIALALPPGVLAAPQSTTQLTAQLNRLQGELRSAGRAFDKAYWRLDEAEVRIARTDKEIARTEADLAAARERLARHVRAMYRSEGIDYLDVILGATSFEELVTRYDFLQRIGSFDANAVAEVEALRARLTKERADLTRERATRAKALSKLKRERDALQRKLRAKQAEFKRVKGALNRARSGGRDMPSGITSLPGPNGMVFPVAGSYYFSDTWGASRSGGRRRHKGTDIMAPRGTPCVAVLSGSVRAKSSGLGGKTVWLTADNGWEFYYAHLDSYAVTSGRVRAGQVIGYVGSTGNATASAPHLHFEIHPGGGAAVNPYPYLRRMQ